MPHPRFDRLTERLLHAGIAPRHVHRYERELFDHFDDLVHAESANGAPRELAETRALSRLGNDEDLAAAMLAKPHLRSITARYPWAVFGFGPVAMLAAGFAVALLIEIGLIELITAWVNASGFQPNVVIARKATLAFTAYNTLAVYGSPLAFAMVLYRMGSRQRVSAPWIAIGVIIVCVLGGFQDLIFYDTGMRHGGVLLIKSGLIPPFSHFWEGLGRATMNLSIAGGVWWLARSSLHLHDCSSDIA